MTPLGTNRRRRESWDVRMIRGCEHLRPGRCRFAFILTAERARQRKLLLLTFATKVHRARYPTAG